MAHKWMLLFIFGYLSASVESGVDVTCHDVIGFYGEKVHVTCNIAYSGIPSAETTCDFELFSINNQQFRCNKTPAYKCKTVVMNINSSIPNPEDGIHTFCMKTECGYGCIPFNVTLNPGTESPTPEPVFSYPPRNGLFIALGLGVVLGLMVVVFFKRRQSGCCRGKARRGNQHNTPLNPV